MRRFKNILCVVNPDEKASAVVRRASELATPHGTELTLVHVVPDVTPTAADPEVKTADERGGSLAKCDAGEQRLLDENGIVGDLVSQPLYGDPSEAIIKEVLRGNHDLLIKPVEGSRIRGARQAPLTSSCCASVRARCGFSNGDDITGTSGFWSHWIRIWMVPMQSSTI